MDEKPLKILFVGDASSYHRTLAEGLRRLGHEATVVSSGGHWLNTDRDIDICRRGKGKLWGLELWLRINLSIKKKLRGYDVVSVATQSYVELRPERQRRLYDYLRANNRSIFNTALGTDTNYVKECFDPESLLRYNEFRIFGEDAPYRKAKPHVADEWLAQPLVDWDRHLYETVDGAVSVLYENDVALRRVLPAEKEPMPGFRLTRMPFVLWNCLTELIK